MPQLAEQQAKVDQIRVLINLVRNAAEAVLQVDSDGTKSNGSRNSAENPSVEVSWMVLGHQLIIAIEDTGPGLMNPTNAFVPFYTTKPAGSGIGTRARTPDCRGPRRFGGLAKPCSQTRVSRQNHTTFADGSRAE